jgi:hypothetical protein
MKAMLLVGVILVGLGIAALLGVLDFSQKKEVLRIGGLEASVQDRQAIPQWAGIAAIVLGGVLVVGGLSRKR